MWGHTKRHNNGNENIRDKVGVTSVVDKMRKHDWDGLYMYEEKMGMRSSDEVWEVDGSRYDERFRLKKY